MIEKTIGVFGSAIGKHSRSEIDKAFILGREIAKAGFSLVSGATFGLPNSAIKGAHSVGGKTIGISPASSQKEHVNDYKLPLDDDVIIYTGFGFEGRNIINIRSSDGCVFLKGSIGTLNELTIAIKEEKVIGILEKSGGVSDRIRELLDGLKLNFKPKIFYSDNPKMLVAKVIGELNDK